MEVQLNFKRRRGGRDGVSEKFCKKNWFPPPKSPLKTVRNPQLSNYPLQTSMPSPKPLSYPPHRNSLSKYHPTPCRRANIKTNKNKSPTWAKSVSPDRKKTHPSRNINLRLIRYGPMLSQSCRPKSGLHPPEGIGAPHKSLKSAGQTSDKSQKLQRCTHGDHFCQVGQQPDKGRLGMVRKG